mgnify:CR=1 FL=1
MVLVDFIAIVIIILGAYKGWKYGCFSSIVSLVGTLLVFVAAFYLKNPLSTILYENLPFQTFGGMFQGITSFNILVYEGISYLICIIILSSILGILIKVTGIVDKLINFTLVFALPSKILGLVIGALQYYIFVFIAVFVLIQLPFSADYFNGSKFSKWMLSNTPLLSNVTNDLYNSVTEVYDICVEYDNKENKEEGDYKALEVLLKYDIITPESVEKLVSKGKIKVEGTDELIEKYKNTGEE